MLGVLNKKEKRRLIYFSFCSILNAALEFLSLGLLIPLIASIVGTTNGNIFLNLNLFNFLENHSTEEKLVIVSNNFFCFFFKFIYSNIYMDFSKYFEKNKN